MIKRYTDLSPLLFFFFTSDLCSAFRLLPMTKTRIACPSVRVRRPTRTPSPPILSSDLRASFPPTPEYDTPCIPPKWDPPYASANVPRLGTPFNLNTPGRRVCTRTGFDRWEGMGSTNAQSHSNTGWLDPQMQPCEGVAVDAAAATTAMSNTSWKSQL